MASSNTTLASLWMDDAQGSPVKLIASTPTKSANGAELKEDIVKFYKESGLEPVAKEVGIIDPNGDIPGFKEQNAASSAKQSLHLVAVPITGSPAKMSPYKMEQQQILPKSLHANRSHLINSPQVQIMTATSPRTPVAVDSQWGGARKRQAADFTIETEFAEGKRGKKGEKGGKGLRHFSMKVCEKVQRKGVTSYNEVADELVQEFSDPRNLTSPSDQAYDQKNIRRRVYDALNVLMAMNIISKEKKEIRWIGLPTNSAQECQNLELEKQKRVERIKHKTQQLQELILQVECELLQQIAFKKLVQRNKEIERSQGNPPAANSAIQLPFIIVNTSKKTVIDCSISNDKYEYLFNFDNTFEIHDDIEVLKRMGMAMGLEKGKVMAADLNKAVKMVPKSLEPYVIDLAHGSMANAGPSGIRPVTSGLSPVSQSRYTSSLSSASIMSQNSNDTDMEVAIATSHGLSRDSSMASHSDLPSRAATETPSDDYSDESDTDRSSPVDVS